MAWARGRPSYPEIFFFDFIAAVLDTYGVVDHPIPTRVLTFVDRRDYQPHPRSDGIVDRKVDDLEFTVGLLRRLYPQHRIDVHSFEGMPFGQQLRIVRESDVLCGVHGAALSHVLFMRPQTEFVEFAPDEGRGAGLFENLAALRAIRYRRYQAVTQRVRPNGKRVVRVTDRPA